MVLPYLIVSFVVLFFYLATLINHKRIKETFLKPLNTPDVLNCSYDKNALDKGTEYLKNRRIVIAGLVRDSEENIDTIKEHVDRISKVFKDYLVLVVENDSKDETRKALLEWGKENPRVIVLGCGINANTCNLNLPKTSPLKMHDEPRIRKMVLLRNIYMDYISDNKKLFDGYDFLAALDMDIEGRFYLDGLANAGYKFMKSPELDGLCANGIKISNMGLYTGKSYFDPYAHKEVGENGLSSQKITAFWGLYPTRDLQECKAKEHKVRSCFNGFTIYRMNSLLGKKYLYNEEGGEVLCEHVTLNSQLNNLYIDPELVFVIVKNK